MDAKSTAAIARLMHDLGDVTSKFKAILKIVSGRAMLVPKCKHLTMQILQAKKSDIKAQILMYSLQYLT